MEKSQTGNTGNRSLDPKPSTDKSVYGDQTMFKNWRERVVSETVDRIRKGMKLSEIMNILAEERHGLALAQFEDREKVLSLTINTQYPGLPHISDIREAEPSDNFLLERLKGEDTESFRRNKSIALYRQMRDSVDQFGKIRIPEFKGYGRDAPEGSDPGSVSNGFDTRYSEFLNNTEKYSKYLLVTEERRRAGMKPGNTVSFSTEKHFTIIWEGIKMTKITPQRVQHPEREDYTKVKNRVEQLFKYCIEFKDEETTKNSISQLYWLLIQMMMYYRGNACITQILIDSIHIVRDIKCMKDHSSLQSITKDIILLTEPDINEAYKHMYS